MRQGERGKLRAGGGGKERDRKRREGDSDRGGKERVKD